MARVEALRIMSWNVLADAYVVAGRYPLSPPALLAPGARWAAVAAHILEDGAEVVCLQEAEEGLARILASELGPQWALSWCPKGAGRPDGCLAGVRRPWRIEEESRLEYPDSLPPSGHVAQILSLSQGGRRLVVASTHLRWAPPGTTAADHIGVHQARLLVARLDGPGPVVVVGDANDGPGGPVRAVLGAAGFREAHPRTASAIVNGTGVEALDVMAARGLALTGVDAPAPQAPMPGPHMPSDHIPLVAEASFFSAG